MLTACSKVVEGFNIVEGQWWWGWRSEPLAAVVEHQDLSGVPCIERQLVQFQLAVVHFFIDAVPTKHKAAVRQPPA